MASVLMVQRGNSSGGMGRYRACANVNGAATHAGKNSIRARQYVADGLVIHQTSYDDIGRSGSFSRRRRGFCSGGHERLNLLRCSVIDHEPATRRLNVFSDSATYASQAYECDGQIL